MGAPLSSLMSYSGETTRPRFSLSKKLYVKQMKSEIYELVGDTLF